MSSLIWGRGSSQLKSHGRCSPASSIGGSGSTSSTGPIPKPSRNQKTGSKPHENQCRRTTIKATRNLYCHHLPKKSAPVYIDEFFKEPQMSSLKNHLQPPATVATTKESEEGREERGTGADDMWESLGLASPLMQGINERSRGVYH